jgi:hypothetical protein
MHTTIDHLDAHDWLIETILEAVEEAMNDHKAAHIDERPEYIRNARTLYRLQELVAAQGTEHRHNHQAIALAAADRHGGLPSAILDPLRRLGFHGRIYDLDQWLTDWLSESTTALGGTTHEAGAEAGNQAHRPN